MEGLLPGHRFDPMEDELLMYYLKPKVNGQEVPNKDSVICEFDLYGDTEPWKIWEMFQSKHANDVRKNKDMYFFTQKKKLSAKASRTCRKVGTGSWKGQARATSIYLLDHNQSPTSTLLGFKTTYTYVNKSSVHRGSWTMYEYQLDTSQLLPSKQANDYVLCLLRNHDGQPKKNKRKRNQEEDMTEESCVEDAHDDGDILDPSLVVVEEPQQKRQCLPCYSNNTAASSFEWADVERWYDQQLLQQQPLELSEPIVAFQGSEDSRQQQLVAESQQREETMGKQCHDTQNFAPNQIHHDQNPEKQMGEENGVMTQAYGANVTDDEGWRDSFMEDLMNDEQLMNSIEVGYWNIDGLLEFSD